ncbi:MAG: phosphate ABC transporter permease PstA [Syntrophomonadaceae bacterium]|jgi:phosphate transport system permease protein|nr:phosphate ABC transporter permease PstA [Syntrophomonadaceae bacterium]
MKPFGNRREQLIYYTICSGAVFVALTLVAIVAFVAIKGVGCISWEFLTEIPSRMGKEGGISSAIVGTLYLTLVALVLSVPLGVGAAVYLTEYQPRVSRFTRLVELSAEALAGIPSIVFGLFGFVFFVIFLGWGWSVLSGGLTLALMILPTIMRTSQEAITAVPVEFRENSLALGATKWQTTSKIVIPSALPGIITGVILSIGRSVGETAAVLLTAGSALGMPVLPTDPARSMAVHLYFLASEGISMERAYGTALLLIIMILIINYLANLSLRRFSYRLKG